MFCETNKEKDKSIKKRTFFNTLFRVNIFKLFKFGNQLKIFQRRKEKFNVKLLKTTNNISTSETNLYFKQKKYRTPLIINFKGSSQPSSSETINKQKDDLLTKKATKLNSLSLNSNVENISYVQTNGDNIEKYNKEISNEESNIKSKISF